VPADGAVASTLLLAVSMTVTAPPSNPATAIRLPSDETASA
jgi:hypothetical protein